MENPVILFIPVSSNKGIGEYMRSTILANAVQQQIPGADIHFILSTRVEYSNSCQFTTHFSHHSATKDTPKVKQVIESIKPDLVIFDCSGRAKQFRFAKAHGAKVIFISQHKKKRSRGLSMRRILNTDIHWVVQPTYTVTPLSWIEKLKLKLLDKPEPKNIGPILPHFSSDDVSETLAKYALQSGEFFLFSSGSGGHQLDGKLAADVFYQSAKDFQTKTGIKSVVIFGSNYPKTVPQDSDIQCLSSVSSKEFLVLLNEAKGRVIGAGGTLLQAIELAKPSVSIAVSKDQPSRLEDCAARNYTISASLDENDIYSKSEQLMNTDTYEAMVASLQERGQEYGLKTALSDVTRLLCKKI
jgi:spore coat polysaccharide biosynthesis predicted glycosyltransferase SpsG